MQALGGVLVDWIIGAIIPIIFVVILFGTVKRVKAKKLVLLLLFTIYFSEVINVVGVPYAQFFAWNPILDFSPLSGLFVEGTSFSVVFQYVANVVMFVPFGILLPEIWTSLQSFSRTTIIGLIVSISIEVIQLFSFRVTAIDDILMNTLGAIIGYSIMYMFRKRRLISKNETIDVKHDVIELLIIMFAVLISTIFFKYYLGTIVY